MSTETFHYFANLPYELRHQIWEMAVRPAGSGMHHFSIFNPTKDENDSPPARFTLFVPFELRGESNHTVAAAPRRAGTQKSFSWTQGNPSSYLWDKGLWTACKESRKVIITRFNILHWNEIARDFRQRRSCSNFYPDAGCPLAQKMPEQQVSSHPNLWGVKEF